MVEVRLPAIRQDLKLLPGSHDEDGAPRWLLHDRVRNRYFTLAEDALALIRHWQPGHTLEEMQAHLAGRDLAYEEAEIKAFIDFLIANNLVLARSKGACDHFLSQRKGQQKSVWQWLLHNYLFIRIPLLRPDPWLQRVGPRLNWLFSNSVHRLLLLMGLLGGVLVLRQWDTFSSTFLYFFSLEGMLLYGLTLVLVKSAHELGHALVSQRLGCRVASMGVAFLVMFPVLYTDTTDAWKLRSRRQRLQIVTAGVKTELYLALVATFLWGILPDGALRSAAFFVATTSWVTSVLVNISPFLRFDGYYAFSDLLGVENLQQRAFALGRWRLRRWLWGLDDPLPEPMPRRRARLLTLYAWGTWLYRFFLFLGIALLVYHLFFKVLGIILFVVEILWFIVMPIFKELQVWRERRADFNWTPARIACWSLPVLVLLGLLLPFSTSVQVPAVLRAESSQTLFATEDGRIKAVYVQAGDSVEAGQVLLEMASPDLEQQLTQTRDQLQLVELKLSRQSASLEEKAAQAVNQERRRQLNEQLQGLEKRARMLAVRAPFSGRVSDRELLASGQWIGRDQALMTLIAPERMLFEGLVNERDLNLLAVGQQGMFIAINGEHSAIPASVSRIDITAVPVLPYPELGSEAGGPVAVRRQDERLVPEAAHYRIQLMPEEPISDSLQGTRMTGMMVVEGDSRSALLYQLERVVALFIRESGF
ncbi:HlyD family efflux transporter periplasmic adaptor subunit [Marinobacterium sediminicola]|uniref:Peptide zinc metalloprotease protein n=1 Tax=Marinobacterium sediminicola TaxID=518898 RepID=A0ABY1S397_9GAMM|nr:HlyD family efflux transporter periplasmic adaptor subunit [Marinobacterium sediminicola]ULG68217.1 HlyD family efflux transporter periplasmic adaptor subunit [Marinobacterium sediminicola]SMR77744.1 putative peptide zinc metalloprotease protein [Marinobacterium sediminicola]